MNDFRYVIQLIIGFFIFVLMLYTLASVTKDSCIEKVKDKPALEIKFICG